MGIEKKKTKQNESKFYGVLHSNIERNREDTFKNVTYGKL